MSLVADRNGSCAVRVAITIRYDWYSDGVWIAGSQDENDAVSLDDAALIFETCLAKCTARRLANDLAEIRRLMAERK